MPFSEHSEEEIFLKCLELPAGDRQSFIETSCGENRSLRDSLIELIASYEETEGFMSALRDEDSAAVASRLHRVAPSDEGPGDLIGRYRLSEKIGEGSWGTVWIARQTEDIDRQVALKILKLGLDTKDFLVRFEAERQMLAMMDHPNIATIFDAGATDFGRPYLVMELVEGYPLLEYADENRLSIEERIELFIRICGALHHAHQKGIIHRDIKPSNILVAEGDDGPIPKVIDFGVAKTTEFRLGDQTQFTNIHTFIGTPLYCSPEQLELVGESVDERSDVYSLGAVLYELVVGRSHFDGQRLTALGLDGFRTIVKEKDPPLPSERFESVTSEERTDIARLRDSAVSKVGMQLKGDVDWIVMQCLEKDCDRRYRTATELADDLRAFIECRPVSAAAPSIAYRTKKFVRRNISKKAAWAIVPAALLCLVGLGLIIESGRRTPVDFVSPFAMALAEDNRSIAVLPFENLSASEADSYLADGLYGELTNALTRIKNIKTISRKSTIRYRDTTKSSSEIGEELGAITLLTGEVEKRGDQIRVSVQLIDAIDDRNLWGESYTKELSTAGIFSIQSEISSAIAMQLQTILVPEENERLSQVPTQNLEALEAYFKGNEILFNGNQVRMPEAVELFERAVELDAEFTLGYVGLALSYIDYGKPLNERSLPWEEQLKKDDERKKKMYMAANTAFGLDYDLPEVSMLQARIHYEKRDYDAAIASGMRAVELNPNSADTNYYLGMLLFYWPWTYADIEARYTPDGQDLGMGALIIRSREENAFWLSKAVELEPTNGSYRYLLAEVVGYLGSLEEEIVQYKKAIELEPDQASLHMKLAQFLMSSAGRNDEALFHLRKSLALNPLGRRNIEFIANAYENMGDLEEAARWTNKAKAVAPLMASVFDIRLLEFRGEHQQAFKAYREYLAEHSSLVAPRPRLKVFNDDLRTGRYEEARVRYFDAFPGFFEPDVSLIGHSRSFYLATLYFGSYAMELAAILMATGETEQANRLIDETWSYFQFHPLVTVRKFQETLVLVLRGDTKGALHALRSGFDEGLRDKNKFLDARLDPIRSEPEFIAMMEVIDADLAKQLLEIRRMEADGELEAIPKLREKDDSI